ncbi:MAG: hypothetical protein KFF49_03275 [Bacteroidales bacterium]|nr:hypothetical protein [Bacteroidales bacterium]
MKILNFLLSIALISIMLVGCEKSSNPLSTDDIDLADDDAVTEAIFDDIFGTADNAMQIVESFMLKNTGVKGNVVVVSDSCPTVTVEFIDEGHRVLTIDFGDGCTGLWEQTRAGKIIITVNGFRRVAGSSRSITFDEYYFNGIKVEGTQLTENMGENDNGNVVFSSTLTGGKLTFPNDTSLTREFYREREWVAGYDTWNIWDDECFITGYASGTTYKGVSYENTIKSALHWKRVCRFFVSGIIEIKREGKEPFELDYGDGECDAFATLRRGDEEKEITLRFRHRKIR